MVFHFIYKNTKYHTKDNQLILGLFIEIYPEGSMKNSIFIFLFIIVPYLLIFLNTKKNKTTETEQVTKTKKIVKILGILIFGSALVLTLKIIGGGN